MSIRIIRGEEVYSIVRYWLETYGSIPSEPLEIVETESELIIKKPHRRKLSELKGLGKSMWEKIDVDKHLNEERDSWQRFP